MDFKKKSHNSGIGFKHPFQLLGKGLTLLLKVKVGNISGFADSSCYSACGQRRSADIVIDNCAFLLRY